MKSLVSLTCLLVMAALPAQAGKSYQLFPPNTPQVDKVTPPGSAKLVAPEANSVIKEEKVVLKWQAVEGADFYTVQLATDPNFRWMPVNEGLYKKTEIEVSVQAGRHYYWRVAANRGENMPGYMKGEFATSTFQTPGDYKGPGPN